MYSTPGRPRTVTDAQLAVLLEWKRAHRTLAQKAEELGISKSTASAALDRQRYKLPSPELRGQVHCTRGRPRHVSDAQLAALLEWRSNRRTLKQKAQELGISLSAARRALWVQGYKQASPELRTKNLKARRDVMKHLRVAGWR